MSRKITNIEELREHALSVLEDMEDGRVDIRGAAVATKLYDNVISSLKTELEYCKLKKIEPNIPFLEIKNTIEAHKDLALPEPDKKLLK